MKTAGRAFTSLLLAVILTAALAFPAAAQSRMKYIDSVSASLGVRDNAATCTLIGTVYDRDFTYTGAFFKSANGTTWTKVKSWSGSANNNAFESWTYGDNSGKSKLIDGIYYKFEATVYAKSEAGTTLESKMASSGRVECGGPDEYSLSNLMYDAAA